MTFLQSGQAEQVKGTWHAAGLIFAAGCALYNLAAWLQRRDRHLAVNTAVYGLLTWWEVDKVLQHTRQEPSG